MRTHRRGSIRPGPGVPVSGPKQSPHLARRIPSPGGFAYRSAVLMFEWPRILASGVVPLCAG